jgi:hypothetical protein
MDDARGPAQSRPGALGETGTGRVEVRVDQRRRARTLSHALRSVWMQLPRGGMRPLQRVDLCGRCAWGATSGNFACSSECAAGRGVIAYRRLVGLSLGHSPRAEGCTGRCRPRGQIRRLELGRSARRGRDRTTKCGPGA